MPAPSKLFTPALRGRPDRPDWRMLPRPQVSSDDRSAGYLATLAALDPQQMIAQLQAAPDRTAEVDLRLAAAMIECGDFGGAEAVLAAIETADPWEWRVSWYRGLAELAQGRAERARASFGSVYHSLPGEAAPKLALAFACEVAGDPSRRSTRC